MRFVCDTSVVMAWFFEDESSDYTSSVLESLAGHTCVVPAIWHLEVTNVLLVGMRRQRCSEAECMRFMTLLRALPIRTDAPGERQAFGTIFPLAKECGLTAYDAAYLELAMREGVAISTLDIPLRKAAKRVGVPLFMP